MTDLELEMMRQQYDAHTLECDFYQDSYMQILTDRLMYKVLNNYTLHDDDIDEEIH